jgi:DnaK suppressor protein
MQKKASTPPTAKTPSRPVKATKGPAGKAVSQELAPPAKPVPVHVEAAAKNEAKKTAARVRVKQAAPDKGDGPAKRSESARAGAKITAKPDHPGRNAPADKRATVKAPAGAKATPAKSRPKGDRSGFWNNQKRLLLEERDSYTQSADALKAQADSLALEHEPGDVQFDEEGGEGGTANVDREMDLHLSAQARATVAEIDRALAKIADGTYGLCEECHQPIPEARLEALPYAALCVSCKSGGLSSRR